MRSHLLFSHMLIPPLIFFSSSHLLFCLLFSADLNSFHQFSPAVFSSLVSSFQIVSTFLSSSLPIFFPHFQLLSFFISTLFISSHPFSVPLISSHLYNLNLSQPYCSDFHCGDRHSRDEHWSDSYCSDFQISVMRKYRLLNVL